MTNLIEKAVSSPFCNKIEYLASFYCNGKIDELKRAISSILDKTNPGSYGIIVQTVLQLLAGEYVDAAILAVHNKQKIEKDLQSYFLNIMTDFPMEIILLTIQEIINLLQKNSLKRFSFIECFPCAVNCLKKYQTYKVCSNGTNCSTETLINGIIKTTCLLEWNKECNLAMVSAFRELFLSNQSTKIVLEKCFCLLESTPMDDISEVVYQILLLTQSQNTLYLFERLTKHFEQLDSSCTG